MAYCQDIVPGIPVETHPWTPFVPEGAKVLFLGTFPPQSHRWAMDFYYPNPTNDFWRIMGLIFTGDADAYYDRPTRSYRLELILELLNDKGIALADTGVEIQRLKGNASDAHLNIVKPIDLYGLINRMPQCSVIATTGEKAARIVSELTASAIPPVGSCETVVIDGRQIRHCRMPSSSRAYPLPLARKAEAYRMIFASIGMI